MKFNHFYLFVLVVYFAAAYVIHIAEAKQHAHNHNENEETALNDLDDAKDAPSTTDKKIAKAVVKAILTKGKAHDAENDEFNDDEEDELEKDKLTREILKAALQDDGDEEKTKGNRRRMKNEKNDPIIGALANYAKNKVSGWFRGRRRRWFGKK